MLLVFVKRGRAYDLNLTSCKGRFQDICRVHRALCAACTDKNVKFVDEQNDVTLFLTSSITFLRQLFKVTSVFAARDH